MRLKEKRKKKLQIVVLQCTHDIKIIYPTFVSFQHKIINNKGRKFRSIKEKKNHILFVLDDLYFFA